MPTSSSATALGILDYLRNQLPTDAYHRFRQQYITNIIEAISCARPTLLALILPCQSRWNVPPGPAHYLTPIRPAAESNQYNFSDKLHQKRVSSHFSPIRRTFPSRYKRRGAWNLHTQLPIANRSSTDINFLIALTQNIFNDPSWSFH